MEEKTKAKRKKISIIIYLLLTALIILSIIYIINFFSLKQEAKEQSKLLNAIDTYEKEVAKNTLEDEERVIEDNEETVIGKDTEEQKKETERMLQVKQLQGQNTDIVGWLEIENTNINYPVLQGADNNYYMTHNYKNEKSKNGSIFLDADYNWDIPSNNLLMYGHNLGNGMMFQQQRKMQDMKLFLFLNQECIINQKKMYFVIIISLIMNQKKNIMSL